MGCRGLYIIDLSEVNCMAMQVKITNCVQKASDGILVSGESGE